MSIGAIITLLSSIAAAVVKIFEWLHEKNLVQSALAQKQLEDLKGQINGIQVAIAAREAVRADVAANPDGVPNDDPFLRD
jgi:hypothetical protein